MTSQLNTIGDNGEIQASDWKIGRDDVFPEILRPDYACAVASGEVFWLSHVRFIFLINYKGQKVTVNRKMSFTRVSCILIRNSRLVKKCANYKTFVRVNWFSTAAEPIPVPQGSKEPKLYPKKIHNIVDEIAKLTLLEVSELNELLKKTLNIPDTPMMAMSMSAVAAKPDEEEAEEQVKTVQTAFTVKMTKFDEAKKVPIIKEVKNIMEGFNLVQAKKFVESVPQVIRADIGKEEAEKIKDALEAAGAICEIS